MELKRIIRFVPAAGEKSTARMQLRIRCVDQFKRLVRDDVPIEFQSHSPVPQFVLDRFPNGVTQIEVPVIGLDVNRSIEGWATFSLIVKDARVINAVEQLLILATFDIDDEAKFHIDHCFDLGGHFCDFWQRP